MASKMRFSALVLIVLLMSAVARAADPLPMVSKVASQPLASRPTPTRSAGSSSDVRFFAR